MSVFIFTARLKLKRLEERLDVKLAAVETRVLDVGNSCFDSSQLDIELLL